MSTQALIGKEFPDGSIKAIEVLYDGYPSTMLQVLNELPPYDFEIDSIIKKYGSVFTGMYRTDLLDSSEVRADKIYGKAHSKKKADYLKELQEEEKIQLNDLVTLISLGDVDRKENKKTSYTFSDIEEFSKQAGGGLYCYIIKDGKWIYFDWAYNNEKYYFISLGHSSVKDAWLTFYTSGNEHSWYKEDAGIYKKKDIRRDKNTLAVPISEIESLLKLVVYKSQFYHVLPNTEEVREKLNITFAMFGKKMIYTTPVEGFSYIQ